MLKVSRLYKECSHVHSSTGILEGVWIQGQISISIADTVITQQTDITHHSY